MRNVGHMAPHDNPLYGQLMIEKWIEEVVMNSTYTRDQEVTPEEEIGLRTRDEGPNANPDGWEVRRSRRVQ